VEWEAIRFKHKIGIKTFPSHADLHIYSIDVYRKSNLLTDHFDNGFVRAHAPAITANPVDKSSGVFVYTRHLETGHFHPFETFMVLLIRIDRFLALRDVNINITARAIAHGKIVIWLFLRSGAMW
jgi:hypothetical protein